MIQSLAQSAFRLGKDLHAVCDDQHPRATTQRLANCQQIKSGQPGFPETRGNGNQSLRVTVPANRRQ